MELKPGYKQTEVGVIPEDWEIQPLGNLADAQRPISYGIVQTGPVIPGGVKCLRVVDIKDGQISKDNLITTTITISNAYKRTILRAGDLVTPLRGKVGDIALVNEDLAGSNLTRGLALIAIRPDKCALFFKQLISSISTRNRLERSMNGSALQEIPIATFRTFKVAFPAAIIEQTTIANALSDADALIQSLTRLIAKKRQIKQGAMQTLLNPYENGRLKEGWVVKKLGDCLDKIVGGGTPSRLVKSYWGKEIPWVTVKDFASFNPHCTQEYITAEGLKNSATNIIARGTIIIATRMALGRAVIYDVDVCINQDLKAIFPKSDVYVFYLKYWLEKNAFLIEELGSGSTVMGVSLEDLRKIEFSMPSKENQTRIATILSGMDAEIAALEAKLAKYRHIKQGMMQNLLTGRIRLIEPETKTGAGA